MNDVIQPMSVLELIAALGSIAIGKTEQELSQMEVYLGDDEELNGIHPLYYYGEINKESLDSLGVCGTRNPIRKSGISLLLS